MFNVTLFQLSLRRLAGRHRWFALFFFALLAALPALFGALMISVSTLVGDQILPESSLILFERLTIALIVPTLALLLGVVALRDEIQNQTIDYLYLKPISRTGIVLSKFAGTIVVVLALAAISIVASSVVFRDGRVGVLLATGAVAVLAYGALFLALSLLLNRAVIWGFAYLLLWEGFLSNISPPVSSLTVKRYVLGLGQGLLDGATELSLQTSLAVLLALTIFCLGLAVWRLRVMEFSGSAE